MTVRPLLESRERGALLEGPAGWGVCAGDLDKSAGLGWIA